MSSLTHHFKISSSTKHAIIVFLLWAFAPLAWYLMWRDKKYHSWFPKLLWINGIIFSIIFVTQSFVFIPKFQEFYNALGIKIPSNIPPLLVGIVLFFVLIQIPAGVHIQKQITKYKKLTDSYVIPILIIFILDGAIALSTGVVSAIQSPTALVNQFVTQNVTTITEEILHTPTPTPQTIDTN